MRLGHLRPPIPKRLLALGSVLAGRGLGAFATRKPGGSSTLMETGKKTRRSLQALAGHSSNDTGSEG